MKQKNVNKFLSHLTCITIFRLEVFHQDKKLKITKQSHEMRRNHQNKNWKIVE